jgi:uncharacterized protein
MIERSTTEEITEVLQTAKTIAVLGISSDAKKPGFYVPDYLFTHGYRIIGVNPELSRGSVKLFGERVRARLSDIEEPVDVVDVFRRPDLLEAHLRDLFAMQPAPKLVWLQQGIRNANFAKAVMAAGIEMVQDRCMLADHQALGI